jgi:LPXTG-motif cell wall-anchored protein
VPETTTIMTLGSTATVPTTTIPEGTTAAPTTVAAAGSTLTTARPTDTTGPAAQITEQHHDQLPFTGSDSLPPMIGLVALALGGGLLVVSRRRNLRRS